MSDSETCIKIESDSKKSKKMSNNVTLNFLSKFIKPYDGKRETLPAFLTNCDNAIALASIEQQSTLCKFIISQLEGKAQVACSLKTFDDWTSLKSFLKQNFGEKKHSTHLLSDLQNCKQNLPSETVTQYSLRIEACLTRLLSDIHFSCSNKDELVGRIAGIEDLALNTFLMGLNSNFSHIVRCRNPKTLNDAVTLAIEEEKLFNVTNSKSLSSKSNKICSTCNKPGHLSSECFRNKAKNRHISTSYNTFTSNSNRFPTEPQLMQNHSNSRFEVKHCAYCKNPGHTINECHKRRYNNNRRNMQYDPRAQSNETHRDNTKVHLCDVNNMSCEPNENENLN